MEGLKNKLMMNGGARACNVSGMRLLPFILLFGPSLTVNAEGSSKLLSLAELPLKKQTVRCGLVADTIIVVLLYG